MWRFNHCNSVHYHFTNCYNLLSMTHIQINHFMQSFKQSLNLVLIHRSNIWSLHFLLILYWVNLETYMNPYNTILFLNSSISKKAPVNQNLTEISLLTLSIPSKIFSRRHTEIFFLFSQKTGLDISCKLSQWRQCAWNVKSCFLGKIKKNITNLLSAALHWEW